MAGESEKQLVDINLLGKFKVMCDGTYAPADLSSSVSELDERVRELSDAQQSDEWDEL